jgi:RHS repeat-associated protein
VTPIVKLPTPLQNRTYQYDAVGNRSASDETANWNYNANHQLLSYGEPASSTSLDYDANGSTIEKIITDASGSDTDAYSYDIANRLTEVKRNGTTLARYYYDPFGRRLSKEVSGIKTYFLYANEGLVGEYNSSGVLINSYMYQPGSMWSTQPLGMITGGRSHFYQHDQLGSPNLVTSNTGQIKWQGAMDAFGQVQTTTSDITNPLRFPGQYYDSETGLHYNYFRDYDPEIGRYIQSDRLGLFDGPNTYAYVQNNPVNMIDPTGEYGLPGFIGGGVFNFGVQLSVNLYLSNGDVGRSLRCINLTDVLVSAVLGTVAPSLISNVIMGKAGPGGLTQAQNAYLYVTKAVPVGFSMKKGIPEVRPSDFVEDACDECSDLKLTDAISKVIQ